MASPPPAAAECSTELVADPIDELVDGVTAAMLNVDVTMQALQLARNEYADTLMALRYATECGLEDSADRELVRMGCPSVERVTEEPK